MTRVYADYNATAPVRPEVRRAVEPILFGAPEAGAFGNASSVHWAGQAARRMLEQARARVAAHTGGRPADVIFTSGGSEADNLAILGPLFHRTVTAPRLVLSEVEHPAVRAAAHRARSLGAEVVEVGVTEQGALDLDALERALAAAPTTLVSVMAVNNETGVILDVERALELAHGCGARLHVDAVQAAGRVPLPVGADLLTLSGHKLGGLPGAGALAIREDVPLQPTLLGGPQERGRRAGTEAVAAAVALAEALDRAVTHREAEVARLRPLRDRLEGALRALDGARVLGASEPRVATTTTCVFSRVDGDAVLQGLDLEGIAASSGSACSSGSLEPSHVLTAMGVPPEEALSAVRFSFGWATTLADVERIIEVLPAVWARARLP